MIPLLLPTVASARVSDIFTFLTSVSADGQSKFPVAEERVQSPVRTLRVIATAYSSDPGQTDDSPCNPAMWSYNLCEHYLKYGIEDTIAANFLPLGTRIRFPDIYGEKVFTVRDRMNARYNYDVLGYYRVDFYKAAAAENGEMDAPAARQKALDFGLKRNLKLEVLAG